MTLHLTASRYAETKRTTASEVFVERPEGREFVCYFLEDGHRERKVYGETRIPPGRYRVVPIIHSNMARDLAERFPWIRGKGIPGLLWDELSPMFPRFDALRIHPGNTHEDTAGCPLTASEIVTIGNAQVGRRSVDAFQKLCLLIYEAWDAGEEVFLTITDHRIRL